MNINDFQARFKTSAYNPTRITETKLSASKKNSAVLIPILEHQGQASILLCKRPSSMKHHPDQICFTGGKVEPNDKDIVHTVLRETHEELSIESKFIHPIGNNF